MNLSSDLQAKIETYLDAVAAQLGGQSAAARQELLAELREHIAEAVHRRSPAPTAADVEAVLAELDPPESYREGNGEGLMVDGSGQKEEVRGQPSSILHSPSPLNHSSRWFAIALAALALNAWAVWKLTHPAAPKAAAETAVVAAEKKLPALKLLAVQQVNLTPERELTLKLRFNSVPNRQKLKQFLALYEGKVGDEKLEYDLVGQAGGSNVLVRAEDVDNDKVFVELKPGLTGDSVTPLAEAQQIELEIATKLALQSLEAEAPSFGEPHIECSFTEQLDANTAAAYVEVSPALKFSAEASWRALRLSGPFQPGTVYTLKFKAGLKSENNHALLKDLTRTVQIPNRNKAVTVATDGRYLSPRGTLAVPVSAMNLRRCIVTLAPVLPQNLVQLALRDCSRTRGYYSSPGDTADKLTGAEVVVTNAVSAPLNAETKFNVSLRDLAGPEPRGLFLLTVNGEDDAGGGHARRRWYGERTEDHRLLAVTDLGLSALLNAGGATVWVNSLRDAKPVAGAEVTLYAENNSELARGTTDASGLAKLTFAHDGKAAAPFLVVARAGADLSFLPLEKTLVTQAGETGGRAYLAEGYEAFVFSDRGIYRPGETAHFKALVRDRDLAAPPAFPALFRILKPNGRVFKDLPVQLDAAGAAETELVLPEFLPTGRYEARLVLPGSFKELGGTVVMLEDFVPPQVRVAASGPAARAPAGQPVLFDARAEHLFGRAAAGLKAKGFASVRPVAFEPKAWKGWQFGDAEKKFSENYRALGSATLDEQGHAQFKVDTSEAWRPPAALRVNFQATVTEASGRPVTAGTQAQVDVYPFYIGLKTGGHDVVPVGEPQRVAVVEVAPDGAAWTNAKPLVVRLDRVEWSTVLRRDDHGRYQWLSEERKAKVAEDTLAASGQPTDYAFTVKNLGEFLLTLSDPASGASSSFRFHAGSRDQQWVSWSREKPDAVELALDKQSYKPGETAKLLIKAPFAGTALLSIASDHVLESRLIELAKNTAEVEIPVRAEFAPNVYCSITLVRPARAESVWSAHRAAGAVALKVAPPNRKLTVAVEAPAVNRPQAQLTARLRVADEAGLPAAADVTVFAVDEAICMLTDFATPDPLKWFLAQRALGVNLFDVYADLMPIVDEAALGGASHPAGGEAGALGRRLNPIKANRFKPVALWAGTVSIGTNGEGVATFAVPEFAGELRLMAVAWNRAQIGAGDQHVKVKRPLVVQPSLPRFLAPGDACAATIALFNESGAPLSGKLRVTCGGPLSAAQPEQPLALKAGEARTLSIPLTASAAPGKALCTVEVEAGAERYRETIELAVRPASALTVESGSGFIKGGQIKTITPPANWIAGTLRQEIWCSGSSAVKLNRAFDYLLRYPYGCLEQTTSGAFPLLYLADLANSARPQSIGRDETEQFVRAAVLRVLSMQQGDGSFALWPFQTRGDAGWAGIYATHFLVEARRAAYEVPVDRLDEALTALRALLDRPLTSDQGQWPADMERRAYACHVLALAGKAEPGWNARLREQNDRLTFAARVHVAAALLAAGEPRQATELMSALGLPDAKRPRDTGSLFGSSTTDAAQLLAAWLDVAPQDEHAGQLARFLDQRQKDGHWGTTIDNALALLALGKYARLAGPPQPFGAIIALPGGLTRAASATQEVHWVSAAGQTGAAQIRNDGPGSLYYAFRAEGVPADGAQQEEDAGLKIRREWLDLDGNALAPGALAQGDLVIVRITLDTLGRSLDNIVIEDLLPAGLEIENASLATAQVVPWVKEKTDWCVSRDQRDDRLLLFTGSVGGERIFYYAARVVTPGTFTVPAITASCMYDPEIRSLAGRGKLEVSVGGMK
jgi:uncharacterized protein YfaS (alpha-2-macroglobulin family)